MDGSQLMGLIFYVYFSLFCQLIKHAVNDVSRIITKYEVIAVALENVLSCLSCGPDLSQDLGELLFF